MALTRKFLQALDIEPDKIDEIIEAHSSTVEALKEERNKLEEQAKQLPDKEKELESVQKELDELKASQNGEDVYKKQYEDLKSEYDTYKKDQEAKETKQKKTSAYTDLLKEIGVSEKRLNSILKVSDFDKIELDNEGKIKDADKLKDSLKEEWADFIVKENTKGADTNTPPANNGGEPHTQSRAAQLSAKYNANMYGNATNNNAATNGGS